MVRFKNRYFVVELVFPDGAQVLQTDLHGGGIAGAIRESVDLNFGDWGAATAMMSLSVKYFSPHTNIGIVRSARDHFRMIWTAMTLITRMKGRDCMLRVLHVSGTIKKAQMATIRIDREKLELAKATLERLGVDLAATEQKNAKDILATDV